MNNLTLFTFQISMNAILAMVVAVKRAQTRLVPSSVAVPVVTSCPAMAEAVWTLMSAPLPSTTVISCAGTLPVASYATVALDTPWIAMEEHALVSHCLFKRFL